MLLIISGHFLSAPEEQGLNSSTRFFLLELDCVPIEPNTGMDLDSEVAKIPAGPKTKGVEHLHYYIALLC